jgi:acetamidase/formamidase
VPLRPFPGVLAVARPPEDEQLAYTGNTPTDPLGKMGWCINKPPAPLKGPGCNTKQPGNFGGNLDLPAMTVGSTTYLPVHQKGGLIWTGDSHAAQGNGEIDLDALETAFPELNVTIDVIHRADHPELGDQPIVETPTGWVTVGYAISLNLALENLKKETVRFLSAKYHLTSAEAEKRMLALWDCPISEVVDEVLGTYCIIPKSPKVAHSPEVPQHDTKTHWVSYARDPKDLMGAMKKAAYESVRQMARELGIPEARAYKLATFVQDCRIERPDQREGYGVACMVPKSILRKD